MPIQIDLGSAKPAPKKGPPPGLVVGIDLGTTNSLVAAVNENIASVLRGQNESPLVSSVVAIADDGKIEAVGVEAQKARGDRAANVLFSVKRLMGRSLSDLGGEKNLIPFQLVDDDTHAQVKIKVGENLFSPVEISSEILKTLKTRAELALGKKVGRAVITVPAYFDDAQRTATKAAGRLAGLDVIRVLNEPTAAALAYGWSNEKPGIVAVYDLGGGTFDLSILRIQENIFEVLATAGNTRLGGDDLDRTILNWATQEAGTPKNLGAFLVECERAKRALGENSETSLNLDGKILNLTREKAESLWAPIIEETISAFAKALADARLNISEIDDVLLVGGSTRLPLVRDRIEKFFGKTPNTTLNPDEAVALGAALQAEILGGRGDNRLLLDVVPLSLGIETMGGVVSKLIGRNSTIPTEAREIYTNHAEKQTAFDIHILQGERELVNDCRSLANFRLRGLEPAPPGFHRIEVLFRIDANGILNVRARDLRSGRAHEVEVRPTYGITDDQLVAMLEASFEKAEEDMEARQLVDARVEADTVIRAAEKTITTSGHLVNSHELAVIKARLVDLQNATRGSSHQTIREAISNFDHVSRELAELQVNHALQTALSGKDLEKV